MITTPALTPFATPFQTRTTPAVVTGAKVIAALHGGLVLALGALAWLGGFTAVGIAAVVEGAVRVGLALALRRGTRRIRIAFLVLCVVGAGAGFVARGLSIIAALVNLVVIRFLAHDDAKAWCAA